MPGRKEVQLCRLQPTVLDSIHPLPNHPRHPIHLTNCVIQQPAILACFFLHEGICPHLLYEMDPPPVRDCWICWTRRLLIALMFFIRNTTYFLYECLHLQTQRHDHQHSHGHHHPCRRTGRSRRYNGARHEEGVARRMDAARRVYLVGGAHLSDEELIEGRLSESEERQAIQGY